MATPKLPANVIAQLRQLADEYEQEHRDGGYGEKTVDSRIGHANRFIDYLEGRFNPRTDYGKRIVP